MGLGEKYNLLQFDYDLDSYVVVAVSSDVKKLRMVMDKIVMAEYTSTGMFLISPAR